MIGSVDRRAKGLPQATEAVRIIQKDIVDHSRSNARARKEGIVRILRWLMVSIVTGLEALMIVEITKFNTKYYVY